MKKATINKLLMSMDKARRHLRIADSYFRELNLIAESRELTEAFESLTELTAKIEAMERDLLIPEINHD